MKVGYYLRNLAATHIVLAENFILYTAQKKFNINGQLNKKEKRMGASMWK
jgi:rRNA-processing protein FCF1